MNGFDSLSDWLAALLRPAALAELGLLVLCLGLAYGVTRTLRGRSDRYPIWLGERGWDGLLFPLVALAAAVLARWALVGHWPIAVFKLAVPLLLSLAIVRLIARVLHLAFPHSAVVKVLERTISWGIWLALVLWFTGLLPVMLAEMDAISWKIGGAPVSLRSLVEGVLSAGMVLVLMLWLSSAIEARLMGAQSVNLSVRKMAANATRAILLLVGLLIALSAAGIPLGALSVMGGAVGVGIGLGLQKLAANYVSGFVILAERSLRIGDTVVVDGFEGRITDINVRYTVIRSAAGRESIVPNEMLITQRVENVVLADPKVALTTPVQVAYGSDVDALMAELATAVAAVPRVLAEPGPAVQLAGFGADGLDLRVVFWIADIENGQGNVRSAVNLAILACLNRLGVEIPFPQRVVRGLPAAAAGPAPAEAAGGVAGAGAGGGPGAGPGAGASAAPGAAAAQA